MALTYPTADIMPGKIWGSSRGTTLPTQRMSTIAISTVYPAQGDFVRRNGSDLQYLATNEGVVGTPVFGVVAQGIIDKLGQPGYAAAVTGGGGTLGQPRTAGFGGVGSRAVNNNPTYQQHIARIDPDDRMVLSCQSPTYVAGTVAPLVVSLTTTAGTSLVVTAGAGASLVAGTRILIDGELMTVSSISTDTITVVRAVGGTVAATHAAGAAIWQVPIVGSKYPLVRAAASDYYVNIDVNTTPSVVCEGYWSPDIPGQQPLGAALPPRAWFKFLFTDAA